MNPLHLFWLLPTYLLLGGVFSVFVYTYSRGVDRVESRMLGIIWPLALLAILVYQTICLSFRLSELVGDKAIDWRRGRKLPKAKVVR